MNDAADADLVAAARAGDRAAFGRLYQRYAGMVNAILLAHAPRPEVADLLQDVFVRALRKLSWLRDASAFRGWLAGIARNRVREHFRGTAARHDTQAATVPGTQAEALVAAAALAAIRELPEAYRETLLMRIVEGMTGPEIAERTGMTAGSVRVNLHRGMSMLRERLEGRTP